MAKTIQTIDLVRWSEPDEQHQVKRLGTANAKEVFDKLEAHLKENNFLPDEYFLFTERNFVGERAELPQDTIDVICHTNYGGSEGIYLDISLQTRENKLVSFATGKTLSNSTDAFLHMSRIGAECSLMLNSGGYKIEMKEVPQTTFKLNPNEETVYTIIDKSGSDTLLKRTTLDPDIDPTPFLIASGAKTENGLIEWDSGKYFSNFNSAVKEFQKSMTESQISEHIHSDKILQINELLAGIQDQNNIYSSVGKFDSNFDYDSVIASLQQVQQTIDDSLRFSRPDNIPEDMIWSEKPSNGFDDDFDPFVYDGSMSPEDFQTAQEQCFGDEIINGSSHHIRVEGHTGTWYVIDSEIIDEKLMFLVESEQYGDDAPALIIDSKGNLVLEDIHNGFDDLLYELDEPQQTKTRGR